MTVLRTDIERALDELISNEEGMRFQGLAVVLAKQKRPELIACERKKDLGLDAYMPASLAPDGIGKGLVSSVTATIGKIKDDATKIQKHFEDVQVLIFTTPHKITNQEAKRWSHIVHDAYGYELIVISREDIITSLMLPSNASICRNHLGISVQVESSVEELLDKARAAVSDVINARLSHPRLIGRRKIVLQAIDLDQDGRETGKVIDLASLQAMLLEGRRIVLEAPAGRGKTTTLIQLAERLGDRHELAFLIDLPIWITSNVELLEFMASMPAFRSRGLRAEDLLKLYGAVHCTFLLNGWNEVSDTYSENAVQALAQLERNFSQAGIIVATRTHHIRPPLPGSTRARLLPLTRLQRKEYLAQALQNRAEELSVILDGDRVLDDLTRTPLILAEVTTLFLSGVAIPRTKMGVLAAIMRLIEQTEEHQIHLERPPITGHSEDYLAALAQQMTMKSDVRLSEAQAREVVHFVSSKLNAAGQIANIPEPAAVLNTLCAHHILERFDYPSTAVRFEHQQFQEFYAALELKRDLWQMFGRDDLRANRSFARTYVNMPVWEEPLRMIAEDISELSGEPEAVAAGKGLIELALGVDPVFAGDLSRLSGDVVWTEVRSTVSDRLRSWYQIPDEHHRRCALAGMLATGSDEFSDILLPLLTHDDQQVRLKTYGTWDEFHVTSLGNDWRQLAKGWKEEHRADFVRQVVFGQRMADVAEEFATTDSSPRVRAAALQGLQWINDNDRLMRVLNAFDNATFEDVLRNRTLDSVPAALKPRALETWERLLQSTNAPRDRVIIQLAAAELGAERVSEGLKEDLSGWPSTRLDENDQRLLKSALNLVRTTDPQWVNLWVANRVATDVLSPSLWVEFISSIGEELKRELLDQISEENSEHDDKRNAIDILVATADVDVAKEVFLRLRTLRSKLSPVDYESKRGSWKAATRLRHLFQAMTPSVAVSGMLHSISPHIDALEFALVTDLIGTRHNENDERDPVAEEQRVLLRKYLKGGVSFALGQDDFNGHLKAYLAMALAKVGEPQDMDDLNRLVLAEIERRRQGIAARLRGERGPLADGGTTGWSSWYVQAIVWLDRERADEVLLRLLSEPEFEEDTARELIQLAKIQSTEKQPFFSRPDYRMVWEARAGRHPQRFDENRRSRYAAAIKERIRAITEERATSTSPDWLNRRLKQAAKSVAVLDGHDSAEYVADIMALPCQWDEWTRVDAIEALLFSGARLRAEAILAVLNPTVDYALKHSYDNQTPHLLGRCLCLLSFVDPPSTGIARIKEVMSLNRIPSYELREVVTAIGHSRSKDALKFLLELAVSDPNSFRVFAGEWIDAIAALDNSDAKRILLSFVDPDIEHVHVEEGFDHHHRERLVSHIIDIARAEPTVRERIYFLCNRELSPSTRLLLGDVIIGLSVTDAAIAGLNLIHDNANPPIPFFLTPFHENIFFEHRPYGTGGSYTRVPRSTPEIRRRLFEMVLNDNNRRRSAWSFLGQIESWRLEYGRPNSEPRHPEFDSGEPWPPINVAQVTFGQNQWSGQRE